MTGKRLATAVGGVLAALITAVNLTATPSSAADQGPAVIGLAADELHVMSFNLRYASDTPPNSWPERRPVVKQLLSQERPDIIGTQEGLYHQLRDIQSDLPGYYDSIGQGRDGGSKGEAMGIFYDSRRLQAHGYRPLTPNGYRIEWILSTPEVETRYAAINTFSNQGQFPSDHLPVQAAVTLTDAG